jgi:hypothetical protein
MAFSPVKGGRRQGKQKWLQMAFSGTGQWCKLGSASGVTLLVHGTVSFMTLMECNTQLRKLSTEQVQSFFFQILTKIPNNKAHTTTVTYQIETSHKL